MKTPYKTYLASKNTTLAKLLHDHLRDFVCKCGHKMRLKDSDTWGKIVRCNECTEVVANNQNMGPS
jgi:hypothetical protein